MKYVVSMMIFLLSILVLSPGVQAGSGSGKMSLIVEGQSKGPFGDTVIVRLRDPDYNVVCYAYIPDSIPTETRIAGGSKNVVITGFAGNISCVKIK